MKQKVAEECPNQPLSEELNKNFRSFGTSYTQSEYSWLDSLDAWRYVYAVDNRKDDISRVVKEMRNNQLQLWQRQLTTIES